MSLVTFTGIAANKTIPVNEIMFYRVTAGQEGKERRLQSETFLACSYNGINHNNIGNLVTKITTVTLSTVISLITTKVMVMLVIKGVINVHRCSCNVSVLSG
jgi:hypothetical protein